MTFALKFSLTASVAVNFLNSPIGSCEAEFLTGHIS